MHFFLFVLKGQNHHLVSLIVLVLQWMLKWSKRVSLRSVSFTNYPTLHHPLLSTFLFFSLSLFFFFFFTCLQILHITKYYKIPRIQNQIHIKFQLRKYTQKIIHSRIFPKYCSMFHNFTSDQQFTSYKILSLLFPMMITIHQRNRNVSNDDDTFSKSAQNSLPWVLPDKYITDRLTIQLILSLLALLLIPPIHE